MLKRPTLCLICLAKKHDPCLQCGAHFVELAFEGKPVSLRTVLHALVPRYCSLRPTKVVADVANVDARRCRDVRRVMSEKLISTQGCIAEDYITVLSPLSSLLHTRSTALRCGDAFCSPCIVVID